MSPADAKQLIEQKETELFRAVKDIMGHVINAVEENKVKYSYTKTDECEYSQINYPLDNSSLAIELCLQEMTYAERGWFQKRFRKEYRIVVYKKDYSKKTHYDTTLLLDSAVTSKVYGGFMRNWLDNIKNADLIRQHNKETLSIIEKAEAIQEDIKFIKSAGK